MRDPAKLIEAVAFRRRLQMKVLGFVTASLMLGSWGLVELQSRLDPAAKDTPRIYITYLALWIVGSLITCMAIIYRATASFRCPSCKGDVWPVEAHGDGPRAPLVRYCPACHVDWQVGVDAD